MDERSVDVDGRVTRTFSAGTGETVIWLHDTLGNRWSAGHDRLGADVHVVAPSMPGFDDSSQLDGIDGPEDVVFWLLDLLSELQLDQATLLGCGLGGWMAAEFAVRYPERVRKLVLVDAYGLRVQDALAADEFALTPPMLRPLLFVDPSSALAQDMLPDMETPERLEQTLHARVAAARLAWQFPYDAKLAGRLRRVTAPALIVWGECDRLVSTAHAHAYASALPDAQLVLMPEAGHYPYAEQPETFATAVRTFIANR